MTDAPWSPRAPAVGALAADEAPVAASDARRARDRALSEPGSAW